MTRWGDAKAIETVYHGHKFRSRLEARHAVFFDQLGVRWDYEPEGFDLDGLRYLPDFWLPNLNVWIEIKPVPPTAEEQRKCTLLAGHTKHPVFLFVGLPGTYVPEIDDGYRFAVPGDGRDEIELIWLWSECPFCHSVGIAPGAVYRMLPCGCADKITQAFELSRSRAEQTGVYASWLDQALKVWQPPFQLHNGYNAPRILAAADVARQSRFDGRDIWLNDWTER